MTWLAATWPDDDRCACGAPLPVDPCIPEDRAVCDDCCPVCGPDRLRERVT